MFNKAEIKEIKERSKSQFNWSQNTVVRLIQNIESLENAVKSIEFVNDICPYCGAFKEEGHKEDCLIYQALERYRSKGYE